MRRAVLAILVACSSEYAVDPGGIPLPEQRCREAGIGTCVNGGRCAEIGGQPQCACPAGFTGPTCEACAPGATCGGSTCAETKCGDHAACSEGPNGPTCGCVAGYRADGANCVWQGVVKDPTFQNNPANAWSITGATLKPTDAATRDPGLVEFVGGTCNVATSITKQSITLPPAAQGEPLALEVVGQAACEQVIDNDPPNPPQIFPVPCFSPIAMTLGPRGSFPFDSLDASQARKRCLGEKYYGKTLDLAFRTNTCDVDTKSVVLDHADIFPTKECPRPGEVLNGNFDGDGGWVAEGTGTAEVVAAIGTMSSRGGRLKRATPCQAPRLKGVISVPAGMAKPALTFSAHGSSGRRMRVLIDEGLAGIVTGTGVVFERTTLCLGDHVKGESAALVFTSAFERRSCSGTDDYEFVVDDLAVVSEPTCPDAAPIVDGDFERSDAALYWAPDLDGAILSFPQGAAPKSGNAHAQITTLQCNKTNNNIQGAVTIPESRPGAGGPVLTFWYKATSSAAQTYYGPSGLLAPTTTWTSKKSCLPPRLAGSPYSVSFSVYSGSSCASGTLSIDDLRVGYDGTCPE
jgi:hypothetical protein